jgi:P27 family predicted phage terminase small subunit
LDQFVMAPHDLAVLVVGLEALDRANAARDAIAAEGMTMADRFGQPRPHPLLTAETQARAQFLAAMKQLGLDYEPVTAHAQTAAARTARWGR